MRAIVIAQAAEISGMEARDIDERTTLEQLGMDSLECICFVTAIEDATGAEIGCGERIEIVTIGDAVDLVEPRVLRMAA